MRKHRIMAMLIAALACMALLQGCVPAPHATKGSASHPAASAAPGASGAADSAQGQAAATNGPSEAFGDAFKTVDKNPLNEDISAALWLAAKDPDAASSTGDGASSALQQYADKYLAIVRDKGVHYVEVTNAMGIDVSTEYWIKDGKYKTVTALTEEVVIFDGKQYIKYDTASKTGTSYGKDNSLVQAAVNIVLDGMLSKSTSMPYKEQKDEKFGKFDCAVFYYDMNVDMMGMKIRGSWLYIDKATGMLVKNQSGDPKDKKNSTATTVKSLTVGGFDDSVFSVPKDVKIEEY